MDDQTLLTVDQFCSAAGIGRTLVYSLIKDKQIKVIKLGRRTPRWPQGKMTRIPASELALFRGR
jgi:excisionase family DNA binding protein